MATSTDNPYTLLERGNISKNLLSENGTRALALYDKSVLLSEKHPNSEEFREKVKQTGLATSALIAKEVARIQNGLKNELEEHEKLEAKKAQSRKVVEKSGKVLDELAHCRQLLKEDRQRKIESGQIAPPKKKNLTTKLREDLVKIVTLIPEKLKEDTNVIARTERAVLKFLNELKNIWGITKIKPIEEEINEKIKKLHEKAA